MKVRWTQNSIRLRITPTELAEILRGEIVTEVLMLSGDMRWQINIEPAAETRLASEGKNAVVFLSSKDRQRLSAPEAEGIYFQTADGLRYLVEKDFPCVHPRAGEALETPTETFDAPGDFEQRKQETESYGK